MSDLTQEELKQLLSYNPEDGQFTRLKTTASNAVKGSVAGHVDSRGYVKIRINGREHSAHRLAWLYVYGWFPAGQIDHVNRNKSDNRITNLREVTISENAQNIGLKRSNKSGYTGVRWNIKRAKWVAHIKVDGQFRHLGCFNTLDAAADARRSAELAYHPFKTTLKEDGK